MYKFEFKDKEIKTDKFIMENTSMSGKKILLMVDTDDELAYYAFFKFYYKLNMLNSDYNSCSNCSIIYDKEGKIITNDELDKIIEKYFPIETKKIAIRKKLSTYRFFSKIMNISNGRVLKYWLQYEKYLIKLIKPDKKEKFERIKFKSSNYIKYFFAHQML